MAACWRAFFDAHPGWTLQQQNVVRSKVDGMLWLTVKGLTDLWDWARQQGSLSAEQAMRLITLARRDEDVRQATSPAWVDDDLF
jgi:hypothetical protein